MDTPDYKALFETSSELLLVVDADFTILSATEAYLKAVDKLTEAIAGRNIFEVFTNGSYETFAGIIDDIKASLKRVLQYKTIDTLIFFIPPNATSEATVNLKRYKLIHSPALDEFNNIKYITQRLEDVTEIETLKARLEIKKATLMQIAESEKRYYMMLMESPFAFSIMKGENLVVTLANHLMKAFWGKGNDVEGRPLLQVLPELKGQQFPAMIISVLNTGVPVYANEILAQLKHNDKMEDRYFNIVYQPYYEADETISGVTTIAYEVTEMVRTRKKIKESEERFRNLVEKSPSPVYILKGEDMILEVANEQVFKVWNVDKEALGQPFLDIIPEMRGQPFMGWLLAVYHNGTTHYGNEEPAYFIRENGEPETIYFNFVYQPYREDDGTITGVMVIATDVTEQVISRKKIEESEHSYREMVFSSSSMIAILKGEEMLVDIANDAILETWGKGKDIIGKSLLTVMPEIVEQGFADLFHQVYTTGQPYYGYEVPVYVVRNGEKELSYYTFIYQAQRDIDDEIVGVAIIATEVTWIYQFN
ncbi:PAS domain-containing protein [Mucilaginibacter sp. 5C4]|uniref:PAS domain-containing protein n=1 Tax=Mucilaginibacter sp. 5C4 TaxID=3048589 RepID=UPI002AC8AC3F|nr:PAS domain-containing protein [Mucilaginibacter sp. 5C4]MEB0301314.1 PAS domain-containing protein [Mucilaginibacter sp. 5C4]WPX22455.1 PAS domain-containing protein [Mucilaginibacter sp. 5C4]